MPRIANKSPAFYPRPCKQDPTPAATALLRGPAEGESLSMAQRLGERRSLLQEQVAGPPPLIQLQLLPTGHAEPLPKE